MISSEYWSASKENERNVVKNCTVVITTIMNASNLSRYFKVTFCLKDELWNEGIKLKGD